MPQRAKHCSNPARIRTSLADRPCSHCADEPMQTCRKIVNWRQYLRFPAEVAVPPLAKDLICRLLCDVEHRLGTNGAAEIKVMGLNWRGLFL